MIKTVALYIRVSTLEQSNGYSIEMQEDKLRAYCKIMDYHVKKVFIDPGHSGSTINRPALKRLINGVVLNEFDCVMVYKLDRLSRSQKDTLYIIEDIFVKNNIGFISLHEKFDLDSPFGRAMIGMLSVFSQLEREQIKERMQMGKVGRAKSGKSMAWAQIPFGYCYKNGNLEIDPLRAPIVKEMFMSYLGGMSLRKLTGVLNEGGHIGRVTPWYYRRVSYILQNETYTGITKFNDTLFEGNHEAIIDISTFKTVQLELQKRQKEAYENNNNPRPFQSKYMLSGLLKCGHCKKHFVIHLSNKRKDGSQKKSYGCWSKQGKAKLKYVGVVPNCESKKYELEMLEEYVLNQIEMIRLNPHKLMIEEKKIDESELDILQDRQKELDNKMKRLVELYIDGQIPLNILNEKRELIENEINGIQNKLEVLTQSTESNFISTLVNVTQDIRTLDYENQKNIALMLIEKVELINDEARIYWKI